MRGRVRVGESGTSASRCKRKVTHASHARTSTDNVVVRCVLDDGTVGYGEGVPRDYVTGETIDSALDLLKPSDLAKQLDAAAPTSSPRSASPSGCSSPPSPATTADPGQRRPLSPSNWRCSTPSAGASASRSSRRHGAARAGPVRAARLGPVQRRSSATRGVEEAACYPLVYRARRLRQVKVKVGIAGHDDVKRAQRDPPLARAEDRPADRRQRGVGAGRGGRRGSANWSRSASRSVEQPVPHEDVACLAEVRKQVKTPVMLDESLCGEVDAERAVASGWCDLFNLRLSKCGGFIPSCGSRNSRSGTASATSSAARSARRPSFPPPAGTSPRASTDLRYLEGSYDRHLVWEALGRKT